MEPAPSSRTASDPETIEVFDVHSGESIVVVSGTPEVPLAAAESTDAYLTLQPHDDAFIVRTRLADGTVDQQRVVRRFATADGLAASPDLHELAYFNQSIESLVAYDIESGQTKVVARGITVPGDRLECLVYVRPGRLLAGVFQRSSGRAGRCDLALVDTVSATVEPLTQLGDVFEPLSVTLDASRQFVACADPSRGDGSAPWCRVFDLGAHAELVRVVDHDAVTMGVMALSPGAATVAWIRFTRRDAALVVQPLKEEGGSRVLRTYPKGTSWGDMIFVDDHTLAMTQRSAGQEESRLVVVDADSGDERTLAQRHFNRRLLLLPRGGAVVTTSRG